MLLHRLFLYVSESATYNFTACGNNDKCTRINFLDFFLDLHRFPLIHHGDNQLLLIVGIGTNTVIYHTGATLQILHNILQNLFFLVRDDDQKFGRIEAVNCAIHNQSTNGNGQ